MPTARAAAAVEPPPGPSVAPDDEDRPACPSDDEREPEELDDDEDAMPPGAHADEAEAADDEAGEEDDEAEEAAAGDDGAGDSLSELDEEQRPPDLDMALTVSGVAKLHVPQLKLHLKWRGLSQAGNKPELATRLAAAVEQGWPLKATLPRSRRGRPAGSGAASSTGRPAANAARWKPPEQIERPAYEGAEKFLPSPDLGLTSRNHPVEWFNKFISKETRVEHAANSWKYKGWLQAQGTDIYPTARKIELVDVDFFYSMHILNGLNPVPSQRAIHQRSFGIKGVRAGDLLPPMRWREVKALFHITDPSKAPTKGSPDYDVLHKVRPLLEELLNNSIANISKTTGEGEAMRKILQSGRRLSIDEITIGFQGHHAQLKQRCGKFKRAGDGLQADAIVLEGGYVVFMVFRGDNTTPTFNKEWSPLHNRCVHLLSKVTEDGVQLFWDNLYPNLDVVQAIAKGDDYQAQIPAGPSHGKRIEVHVPKILSDGTTRTNRGIPSACLQPNKKGMSKKNLEAIKAKPPSERLKVMMTESEPNVLCISFFDNGPVHMLSTIHEDAKFITIHRRRWDGTEMKVVKIPIERLEVRTCNATRRSTRLSERVGRQAIHDYNMSMNNVDIFDQLSHNYGLDGMGWRDRKWWMPVFKALLKGACDQAYTLYKRTFELEQERAEAEKEARAEQQRADEREEQQPEERDEAAGSPAQNTRARKRAKPKPMSHFDFLEKIAEGLFIEGYNSTKRDQAGHLDLRTYSLEDLEQCVSELHGDRAARPSKRAKGLVFDDDKLLPASDERAHVKIAPIPKGGRVCCAFRGCPQAAKGKPQKCGEGMTRLQAARARCAGGVWCFDCKAAFHADCHTVYHRRAATFEELEVKLPGRKKRKAADDAASKAKKKKAKKAPTRCAASSSAPAQDENEDEDDEAPSDSDDDGLQEEAGEEEESRDEEDEADDEEEEAGVGDEMEEDGWASLARMSGRGPKKVALRFNGQRTQAK